MNSKKLLSYAKTLGCVILGNIFIAFSVSAFVSSSGIIIGGCTGISLILKHYFPIPLSLCVLIINLLFFTVGTLFLGKKFAVTTVASTFIYPAALQIFEWFPILQDASSDIAICAIFGGLLVGAGIGIIDRTGGSTGGTDIIALIINKYTHTNVGTLLYVVDGIILLSQAVFSNTMQVLYGILFLLLQMIAINKTMISGRVQIQLLIVSDHYNEIRDALIEQHDVGVTMVPLEKGFTKVASQGVLCITSRKKLHRILDTINYFDDNAFMSIHEVNEVHGRGFTKARVPLRKESKTVSN